MNAVTMPVLLMPAGDDGDNLKGPDGEIAKIVAAKGGSSVTYAEMKHGYFSRGDISDAAVKRDAEDSMTKAIAFFGQNL